MRRLYIFLFIVALATSGCGSCDDTAGNGTGENNQTDGGTEADADVNCLDEDNDGFLAGEMCEEATDCDDSDASVNPDAMETCGDGIDNNCSGTVDDGCEACTDGDTRDCGTDVGACEIGTQTCNDGTWSACEGGVERDTEVCDGIDNDCDGEVDENAQSLCDDGVLCNGQETCNAGTCESGEAVDCSELDGACTIGQCAEKDGTCVQILKPDGETCDDGNFCTVNGTCNAGVCETEARDCSGESDQCNTGVCDEEADSCVPQPVSDGTTCDDGAFCTVNDVCTAGVCGGGDRDCSGESDQCNTGVCDETADSCVPDPVSDGTTCEDGEYCTVGDTCQAGTCESGGARQCGAAGGSCRTGVCNEQTDQCDGDPVPDGTSCDDGSFCTVSDSCVAGTCQGGGAKDCSGEADQCNTGICNDNLNRCEPDPVADGTSCSDGAFCTENDTCQAGSCQGGNPIDCSGEDDQCNTGVCDDSADSCVKQPLSDGTNCSDGQFCTQNDTCQTGTCTGGPPPNCSSLDDQCNTGVCDENADSCVADPVSDGTSCDDGSFCTTTDSCQPGPARDCSGLDDQCNTGICDDSADSCVKDPVSDGTTCDDGSFCTTTDSCQSGSCDPGPARDCSGLDDQCNTGICDDTTDSCIADPVADGTTCSDGEFCTEGDACLAGSCDPGGPRDCSGLDDQCNTGICDESADSCIADPVSDGTTCSDGSFCTDGDTCQAGSCDSGPARDCSGLDDQCNTGICDDNADSCVQDPVANGTTCTDGSFCTDGDTCQAGSCDPGPARDCSGLDDQCNTGICDDSTDSCVADPVSDGTSCDDGLYCTSGDTCQTGSCQSGPSRDCSGLDDQCNTGICDEGADSCVQDPVSDGTSCDDGAFCTLSDSCQSGTCSGGASRDCSSQGDQCNVGICDEGADSCVPDPVSDGTTCDDGLYCTVSDSCTSGICDGATRDCSAYDSACEDGVCDETNDTCFADQLPDGTSCNDGLSCTANDTCSGGVCGGSGSEPVADAGPDQNVVPNTTVQLDGTGSSDPDGQSLNYNWTVSSRPSGSSATISNPSDPTPTLLADVAGTYEICLTVTDSDGCQSSSDCMTITVVPQADLLIELVWFSDDSDVDVHFRAPNGSFWDQNKNNCGAADQGTDVFYCVPNPDWGQGGEGFPDNDATNDPRLDVDNITGYGPENINQDVLFDTAAPERVAVHYFRDRGAGDGVSARIRIYVSGVLQFEDSKALDCQDFWEVADIEVSNTGTVVQISSVDITSQYTLRGYCP